MSKIFARSRGALSSEKLSMLNMLLSAAEGMVHVPRQQPERLLEQFEIFVTLTEFEVAEKAPNGCPPKTPNSSS